MNYARFLNKTSSARQLSPIRVLSKSFKYSFCIILPIYLMLMGLPLSPTPLLHFMVQLYTSVTWRLLQGPKVSIFIPMSSICSIEKLWCRTFAPAMNIKQNEIYISLKKKWKRYIFFSLQTCAWSVLFWIICFLSIKTSWHFSLTFSAALLARSPPTMISLAAGSPNPNLFPFASAQFHLKYVIWVCHVELCLSNQSKISLYNS